VNLGGLTLGPDIQDKQRRFIAQFGDTFGVLYNTSKLSANDVPKTLKDLGDPKHKGFVIDDPKAGLVTSFCWMAMLYSNKLPVDALEGIKANAVVVQDALPYYQQITTGQLAMLPWAAHSRYLGLKKAGAPVGFSATPGLAVVVLGATGIIKGAPHPNAAKLFSTWFLTPEAQKAIVELGNSVALLKGITYPAGWPDAQALNTAVPQIPPGKVHQALVDEIDYVKKVFK
jgi:iron(III) transport system substrate-binding protein